jgi:vancomycin resistance protein YoaR
MRMTAAAALLLVLCTSAASGTSRSITIASFATSVEDQDANVRRNIMLAARRLDGLSIAPGTVFSFNEIVGEGSAANGYAAGRVLYRDETRMEPGGGLCQVSSTLFNALLAAGFDIVERHRHYQPVAYVPCGLDATIKYGKKDLRMKNPHGQAMRIRASLTDASLLIVIHADAPLPFRYEIEAEEEELESPPEAEGRAARAGINVSVYRKKFAGAKPVERFLLYRDFYPPVRLK